MSTEHTRTSLLRYILVTALAVILACATFAVFAVANSNFHTVSTGRLYRSAQMNAATLSSAIQAHGIKTIINLRGSSADEEWYQTETNTARLLGTQHYDFSLSASREVMDEEIEQILAVMASAPKPLLIHCKSGADRTGLLSALYLYRFEGKSANEANGELTVFDGHFPYLFWRNTIAMDHSFWRFVGNHVPSRLAE
jgi:protein tyrosine phosphatase (PTP) superfamily phosphohydrolase (DUF442 family)